MSIRLSRATFFNAITLCTLRVWNGTEVGWGGVVRRNRTLGVSAAKRASDSSYRGGRAWKDKNKREPLLSVFFFWFFNHGDKNNKKIK